MQSICTMLLSLYIYIYIYIYIYLYIYTLGIKFIEFWLSNVFFMLRTTRKKCHFPKTAHSSSSFSPFFPKKLIVELNVGPPSKAGWWWNIRKRPAYTLMKQNSLNWGWLNSPLVRLRAYPKVSYIFAKRQDFSNDQSKHVDLGPIFVTLEFLETYTFKLWGVYFQCAQWSIVPKTRKKPSKWPGPPWRQAADTILLPNLVILQWNLVIDGWDFLQKDG